MAYIFKPPVDPMNPIDRNDPPPEGWEYVDGRDYRHTDPKYILPMCREWEQREMQRLRRAGKVQPEYFALGAIMPGERLLEPEKIDVEKISIGSVLLTEQAVESARILVKFFQSRGRGWRGFYMNDLRNFCSYTNQYSLQDLPGIFYPIVPKCTLSGQIAPAPVLVVGHPRGQMLVTDLFILACMS